MPLAHTRGPTFLARYGGGNKSNGLNANLLYTYSPGPGAGIQGTGKALIQPVLDNQLKAESPLLVPPVKSEFQGTVDEAIDLVKDCFASAAERDIYTGDAIQIIVITKDGIREERQELKRD